MTTEINILDALTGDAEPTLELIRLDESDLALVFFTPKSVKVTVHYCHESEIRGYAHCLENDCVLCRIGRRRDDRYLLPAYLPAAGTVGVLPVPTSLRPNALLPQLAPILEADKPMVAFVTRRDRSKYTVTSAELPDAASGGEHLIKKFLEDYEKGEVQLDSIFQRLENKQLASVSEIAEMMKLKGIEL